jgi:hypothetical protein
MDNELQNFSCESCKRPINANSYLVLSDVSHEYESEENVFIIHSECLKPKWNAEILSQCRDLILVRIPNEKLEEEERLDDVYEI